MVANMMDEGKFDLLIKQKRVFLKQALKDYSAGGNDMLDDVETALAEAKAELSNQLEVASCLRDEEETWQRECNTILTNWFAKWFGKP
jgi:hypothetical protein